MRFRNSNVLLILELAHLGDNQFVQFSASNNAGQAYPISRRSNGNSEILELTLTMPNKVILELTNLTAQIELRNMTLANIPINNALLSNLIEFQHVAAEPIYSTTWNQDGRVIFNFFGLDPIAYHFHIGNKIRI